MGTMLNFRGKLILKNTDFHYVDLFWDQMLHGTRWYMWRSDWMGWVGGGGGGGGVILNQTYWLQK